MAKGTLQVDPVKTLRGGDYPGSSRWVQCHREGSYIRRRPEVRVRERAVTMEAEVGTVWGHEPRNAGDL